MSNHRERCLLHFGVLTASQKLHQSCETGCFLFDNGGPHFSSSTAIWLFPRRSDLVGPFQSIFSPFSKGHGSLQNTQCVLFFLPKVFATRNGTCPPGDQMCYATRELHVLRPNSISIQHCIETKVITAQSLLCHFVMSFNIILPASFVLF